MPRVAALLGEGLDQPATVRLPYNKRAYSIDGPSLLYSGARWYSGKRHSHGFDLCSVLQRG